MINNKKRVGFALAFAGMIAALLFEPVNGRKRRDRIGHVMEPAGRPLQAMRSRLSGKSGEKSGADPGATLVERLQHVAVRAQGKIDLPNSDTHPESETYAGDGATQEDGEALKTAEKKPGERPKQAGSAK